MPPPAIKRMPSALTAVIPETLMPVAEATKGSCAYTAVAQSREQVTSGATERPAEITRDLNLFFRFTSQVVSFGTALNRSYHARLLEASMYDKNYTGEVLLPFS